MLKKTVDFIFELNHLKRQKHSGWRLAGVNDPFSIAGHVMRTAQIGYILAIMEGDANPEKVASILIVHENGEARIGDQNKVSARYFDKKEPEHNAFHDQIADLDEKLREKWIGYFDEFEERTSKEGIIAKDADWLETAFQAKEYVDQGYESAQDWIDNVEKALETESAKKLLQEMKQTKFTDWWKGLKKMTYTKLN